MLADRRTILKIGKVIKYLEVHTSAVTLHVLDMPGMDLITGFPVIITKYSMYFLNVMTDIHEKAQKPWMSGEDGQEESPEELDTAIPLSFVGPLYYIMNEREELLQAEYTCRMLSEQTPWGLVRPLYMPEGVSPASGILQTMMRDIFLPYDEWSIIIFDNILLAAHDYTDAFEKLNTILKFAAQLGVEIQEIMGGFY